MTFDWTETLRYLIQQQPCHDDPMPGTWLCGSCPYMNHGATCTKCGAPRYEGSEYPSDPRVLR